MEILSPLSPTTWTIVVSAILICGVVLFAKTIKATLKLAVIAVMLIFVLYSLRQAGII